MVANNSSTLKNMAAFMAGLGITNKPSRRMFGFNPKSGLTSFLKRGNKYEPHQGKQQCERRLRQIEKGFIKVDWKKEEIKLEA